jgi:hypothetical protein
MHQQSNPQGESADATPYLKTLSIPRDLPKSYHKYIVPTLIDYWDRSTWKYLEELVLLNKQIWVFMGFARQNLANHKQTMTQPNFALMAQGAATFSAQLALYENIPAIDGGAAILTRLDDLTTQMTDQMTNFTNEIRAKSVSLSPIIQYLLTGVFRDTNALARLQNRMISNRNYPITPLVNLRTGTAIHLGSLRQGQL